MIDTHSFPLSSDPCWRAFTEAVHEDFRYFPVRSSWEYLMFEAQQSPEKESLGPEASEKALWLMQAMDPRVSTQQAPGVMAWLLAELVQSPHVLGEVSGDRQHLIFTVNNDRRLPRVVDPSRSTSLCWPCFPRTGNRVLRGDAASLNQAL